MILPNLLPNLRYRRRLRGRYHEILGFTLLEVLVVLLIAGILTTIISPSWLGFFANQSLNSAQTQAFIAIKQAQSNAKRSQTIWQVSFRNTEAIAQYAIHPAPKSVTTTEYWNTLPWQNFQGGVRIIDSNDEQSRTTFTRVSIADPDVYRVQFKPQGSLNGALGKITFGVSNSNLRKCVVVSTILGATRLGESSTC